MMELIIKIPDEAYKLLKKGETIKCCLSYKNKIEKEITDGIVIPKGLYPDVLRFMADSLEEKGTG